MTECGKILIQPVCPGCSLLRHPRNACFLDLESRKQAAPELAGNTPGKPFELKNYQGRVLWHSS